MGPMSTQVAPIEGGGSFATRNGRKPGAQRAQGPYGRRRPEPEPDTTTARRLAGLCHGWWRRRESNPRPKRLKVVRYVRLPGTPRRVSLCLSRSCQRRDKHHIQVTSPTPACCWTQNVLEEDRVSFPIEHWGSRSPQTSLKRLPPLRSCCCCWQLNQSWTIKAVPQPATPTHLWSPRRNQCAPVIHLRAV